MFIQEKSTILDFISTYGYWSTPQGAKLAYIHALDELVKEQMIKAHTTAGGFEYYRPIGFNF